MQYSFFVSLYQNQPSPFQLYKVMDDHTRHLQSLCRVCGKKKDIDNLRPVLSIASNIRTLFDIDIKSDTRGIHPTNCCKACCSLLQRCVKIHSKKGGPKSTPPVIASFNQHTANCEICCEAKTSQFHVRKSKQILCCRIKS